ncbi:hypothetical protein [Streptomyces sp. NPDC056491]|uniref:hypothetical protein n=1 Tax=Streptomyces sp. NPDC056491 TaxID=3345837 RepID=UPI0036CEA5D1
MTVPADGPEPEPVPGPGRVAKPVPEPVQEPAPGQASGPAPEQVPEQEAGRGDYTGAVYGSLLAASVVVGAGTLGKFPRLELVLLLLGTGVVFWAAHVFARLFGARMVHHLSWGVVRRTSREEFPIIKAAVPPAVAAAVAPWLGLGPQGIAWLALAVALIGQVGWATVAASRAGASRRLMLLAGAINLLLGLLIVLLKVALQH